MRVLGVNIGHDVTFTSIRDGTCEHYEDLSRSFRRKFLSFNLSQDDPEDQRLLRYLKQVSRRFMPDYWAVTINPLDYDYFCRALEVTGQVVGELTIRNPQEILRQLVSVGYAQISPLCWLVEHGVAHLSSAWFTSSLDSNKKTLGVSLDGWSTISADTVGVFQGSLAEAQWERHIFPVSGNVFDTFLAEIMFGKSDLSAAGKIMGYACHGQYCDKYADYFVSQCLPAFALASHSDVVSLERRMREQVKPTLQAFPFLCRSDAEWTHRDEVKNFFATIQEVFSGLVVKTFDSLVHRHKPEQIIYSGGCALSVVTNSMLRNRLADRVRIYIPPFANDLGQAYGAATFVNAAIENNWVPQQGSFDPFLGDTLDWNPTQHLLEPNLGCGYEKIPFSLSVIAEALELGCLVGWFEGRYAVGPRALGDRSILACPWAKGMAHQLNSVVKQREWYRPYAAVVDQSSAPLLLVDGHDSWYMLYDLTPTPVGTEMLRECLSGNGKCRAQILPRSKNELLGELLAYWGTRTGIGALLNTSLNQCGLPIVGTTAHAFEDAQVMRLDYLVVDGSLYRRNGRACITFQSNMFSGKA